MVRPFRIAESMVVDIGGTGRSAMTNSYKKEQIHAEHSRVKRQLHSKFIYRPTKIRAGRIESSNEEEEQTNSLPSPL